MRALPRMLLAVWLSMIAGFCIYGFLATYQLPGETFCRSMYTVLIVLSGVCITQVVVEPMRERC